MYKLRDYQQEAVDICLKHMESSSTSKGVLVAPTSSGKSLIAANIAKELGGRTVVFQPSKELLEQNYEKYTAYGNEAGIYSASVGRKDVGDVTFATAGSVKNMSDFFRQHKVKNVLVDECHFASGPGMMLHKFIKETRVRNVIGMTATPFIMKAKQFEKVRPVMLHKTHKSMFTEMLHIIQIQEMVNNNYWSPLIYEVMDIDRNAYKLNSTGGDFTHLSLQEGYRYNDVESKVLVSLEKLLAEGHKSIIVFVPTVDQAERLAKIIKDAEVISSRTKKNERDRIITGFKNLDIPILINCKLLSIGFDHPQLTGLIMARPVSSVTLYYQILGRAVRIHPEKEFAKVIDIAGNVEMFGRIEDFRFIDSIANGWELYSGKTQITNVAVDKLLKKLKDKADDTKGLNSFKIKFGKHKGKPITAVDTSYLEWVNSTFNFYGEYGRELKKQVKKELKRRQSV